MCAKSTNSVYLEHVSMCRYVMYSCVYSTYIYVYYINAIRLSIYKIEIVCMREQITYINEYTYNVFRRT